jgi:beta-phosphoglucomutase
MSDLKTHLFNKSAILFDMDGTLVNTEPLHARAAVKVLEELGIKIDLMSCIDQFYGMTDTIVLQTVCPQMTDAEIEKAIQRKNLHLIQLFHELSEDDKKPLLTPGVFAFLDFLKKENIVCGVVSASEDIIVKETLESFGLAPYMKVMMGRNQTTLTKPHPDPYLEGMKRLGTTKEKCLIFEDSPTGIKSASSSGASVIRITEFSHPTSSQVIEGTYVNLQNYLF